MVAGDFALKPKQQQQKQTNKKKNKTKQNKNTKPNKTKQKKKHISQSSFFHISSETKCFFF